MLLGENDISEVVRAVRAILDTSTVNQERQRCTQKIEELKEGDPSKSVSIAFELLNQTDDVSPVGWKIIEHVIRYKWNDMSADIRITIRNGVLQYMSNGGYSLTSESLYVKSCISGNLVAMMEQEWPQNWRELFGQFKNIILNPSLHAQAQMVFIVLKRLIENVITYCSVSNALRRKELSTAINDIMPEMLTATIRRIKMCLEAGNTDNSIYVAKSAIELLSESVDWVVGRVLEEIVDNMIEVLCAYLQVATHGIYETAATCLFKIASRKRAKTDETSIVLSMFKDAPMQAIIGAASLAAGVSSSSADHYQYLKALCDLLTALGVHLSEIWAYVKNPPPNFSLYLTAIYSFFTHPSMAIRADVSQVLVTFANHDKICSTQEFMAAVKEVISVIPKNLEKIGSLDDNTSMTSYYARMDYEDDVEFTHDFIQLRDRVIRFIRESLPLHLEQYMQQLSGWIDRVILQTDAIPVSEWESLKRYMTVFMNALYQKGLVTEEVDAKLVVLFNSLMRRMETVNNVKTANLMLSIPSSFLQLFEKHSELIPGFFEHLKQILLINLNDLEIVSLKRHAISLMLKVCSTMPNSIQNHAELIFNIVTTSASNVTVLQRANLVQVLGSLSNLAQPSLRLSFLQSAIQSNIDYFKGQTYINAIASVPNFMAYIGLTSPADPDDKSESQYYLNRLELKAHLCTIDGVLQQVNASEDQSNPLFQLLNPILSTFFQMAHCLNTLRTPANQALIHSSYERTVTDISASDRHAIYCAVMEAEEEATTETNVFNATEKLQKYISDIFDVIQSIIGLCGSKLFYDFYSLPNLQDYYRLLLMDVDLILDFRMRYWIRRTFRPMIRSCPGSKISVVLPFAAALIQHMQTRLQNLWQALKNVDYEEEQTKEEIFLEHMTCVLSREYVAFLKSIFMGDANVVKALDDSKKLPSELLTPSGTALLQDRSILINVIVTLCVFLNCKDSQTMLKAFPVARTVLGTSFNVFDEELANFVFIQALQSLQVHGADDVAKGPLLGLIFSIYTTLRPRFPALRNVLQEVPGTTVESVTTFDERVIAMAISDKAGEKHRRDMMQKFLRPIIAKNLGEQHKRPSHFRVLQPLQRPLKYNGSNENGSSDVSFDGLFATS